MVNCKGCDSYEYDKPASKTNNQKTRNLFRSEYADIMVKVESDVYHLDKLQLALKSDYFEKLFIENFQEKNSDLVEFSFVDSKTFSAIVDIIYGKNLKYAINDENCIPVLMAMDYLQMEIDLPFFANFIKCYNTVRSTKPMNAYIFTLYNLILENQNFSSLLPSVFQYLSTNLLDFQGWEEFLAMPIEHFIKIISIRDSKPSFQSARKFIDFCVEWIWYNVENRLQHVLECVNAAKRRFNFPNGVNDEKLIASLQSQLKQKMKRETLAKCFYKLLIYKGKIDDATEESKLNVPNNESLPKKFPCSGNDQTKWARFLESGDLCDIKVKVEEKTYELHRMKLLDSATGSDYFKKLFKFERMATTGSSSDEKTDLRTAIRPNKDKEYFLDGVDQKSFDLIIKHIYLDERLDTQLTSDNIVGVLNAAIILKICHLEQMCFTWATENIEQISWDLATEILELTRGNYQFDGFHGLYFRKRVPVDWPDIGDNVPLFCSVSFEMLEEILVSETLPFDEFLTSASGSSNSNFCIEDQNKLLDICSKWVSYDIKNRYDLIPRIALAINCNGTVDYNDYKMEPPADFANCSQQLVRDKLSEILHSASLIPDVETSSRNFENDPVFISKTKNEIYILNAELDCITSLRFFQTKKRPHYSFIPILSATTVKDNVFILSEFGCFQVFNVSSKNFVSLSPIPRMEVEKCDDNCTLLNCRDEIYCCLRSGYLLKYSVELNRWTKLLHREFKYDVEFASDGKQLYRIHEELNNLSPTAKWNYIIDVYNFDQNVWNQLPNMTLRKNNYERLCNLAYVNDKGLIASFYHHFYLFDENSQCWINFPFPCSPLAMTTPTQCGNGNLVYVLENKLVHLFGSNQNRNSKKWDWIFKKIFSYSHKNIAAIHRPGFV